jgi:hypothetical protein
VSKKKDSSRFDALFGAARQKEPLDPTDSKPTKKSKSTDPDYGRTTGNLPKYFTGLSLIRTGRNATLLVRGTPLNF